MRTSLLFATLSWMVVAGHAKPETSASSKSSEFVCPRPELLRPCMLSLCEFDYPSRTRWSVDCNNVNTVELKAMFVRLSAEQLPKDQLRIISIKNSTAIESFEYNSTGSIRFDWLLIELLDNLVKIHEAAFVGTEQRIQNLYLILKPENKSPSKWQPNLPLPYHWLGLVQRLKSLARLEIRTRGPIINGDSLHLPASAFHKLDHLREVIIVVKNSRVTIASRAFAGGRSLNYAALGVVDRVPAEIFADMTPPQPTDPVEDWPFRFQLAGFSNITESSFDPRAFAGCCRRPVHLDLNRNPIQTLPEAVFRPFFDGHPDNLVNVGETKVDSGTPGNAWWAKNKVYRMMVLNFTKEELKKSPVHPFPVQWLGRRNKFRNVTKDANFSDNTETTASTSENQQPLDESDDPFMELVDDNDDDSSI